MGIIYLIQPAELIDTTIYKIGGTSNSSLNRIKNKYKLGTRNIAIFECKNPFDIEKCIIKIFNKLFICIEEKEYFSSNCEDKIRIIFTNIVNRKIRKYNEQSEDNNKDNNKYYKDYEDYINDECINVDFDDINNIDEIKDSEGRLKKYICKKCGKRFVYSIEYRRHIK